ncbi:MAG: YfhO family protein [Candidatus Hydrogenedentota bacterium]
MRRAHSTLLESAACAAVLVILPLAVHYSVLLGDEAPMALDSALYEAPWASARPVGSTHQGTPFELLQARRYFPWYAHLSHAVHGDASLFWNSREACGMPFMALWQTRVFSPFSLPFYLVSFAGALALSFVLKMIVAGLAAFYTARRLAAAPALALLAGVTFQLSAPVFLWRAYPLADVIAWFPLLVLVADQAALGQRRWWAPGGIVVLLMALGGDGGVFAVCLLFGALYATLRTLRGGSTAGMLEALSTYAKAVALGLGLAALQLVPYFEYLRLAAPGDGLNPDFLWGDLIGLLAPALMAPGRLADLPAVRLLYTGAAPALLLVLWLAVRRYAHVVLRRRADALLVLGVVFTLGALAASAVHFVQPQQLLAVNSLAIALVAAWAGAAWLELNAGQCKGALVRLAVLIPLLWGGGALLVYTRARSLGSGPGNAWAEIAVVAVASLVVLLLLAVTTIKVSARLMGYTAAALSGAALLLIHAPAADVTEKHLAFPKTSFVAALDAAEHRVTGSTALDRWPLSIHGIAQTGNPSGLRLAHYAEFMDRRATLPLLTRHTGSKALLLKKADIQGAFAPLRPQLGIDQVFTSGAILFEDRSARPRAWMARDWQAVTAFAPERLTPDAPPQIETDATPEAVEEMPEEPPAITVDTQRNTVRLAVNTPEPGVLVLMDAWYPGWQVRVDGASAQPLRVNGLFRGVALGEGSHDVVWHYNPGSFKLGLLITAIAGAVLLIGCILLWRDRHKVAYEPF